MSILIARTTSAETSARKPSIFFIIIAPIIAATKPHHLDDAIAACGGGLQLTLFHHINQHMIKAILFGFFQEARLQPR